jgi:hypothetical protein
MTREPPSPSPSSEEEDERLQAAWASVQVPSSSRASGPAVEPARIWAALHGELADEERCSLVDRMHRDPAFALEWRLALELYRAEREHAAADANRGRASAPEAGLGEPASATRRKRYAAAVMAVAFASAALVLVLVTPRDGGLSVERSGPVEPALRSAGSDDAVRPSLGEGESLPRDGFTLRWSSGLTVSHYEVHVTTERLTPVHTATYVEGAQLTIPREALESVTSGTALLWRVVAIEADGTRHPSAVWRVVLR